MVTRINTKYLDPCTKLTSKKSKANGKKEHYLKWVAKFVPFKFSVLLYSWDRIRDVDVSQRYATSAYDIHTIKNTNWRWDENPEQFRSTQTGRFFFYTSLKETQFFVFIKTQRNYKSNTFFFFQNTECMLTKTHRTNVLFCSLFSVNQLYLIVCCFLDANI